MFLIAAVMYVDDTDLLHWAPFVTTTDEELIEQVQQATNDWGLLSQATGGILKQEKCSVYFLSYKFVNGRARLKSLEDLPPATSVVTLKDGTSAPSHISITQTDGTPVPIQTHDVSEPSRMLGVHYAPIGDGSKYIANITELDLIGQTTLQHTLCLAGIPG